MLTNCFIRDRLQNSGYVVFPKIQTQIKRAYMKMIIDVFNQALGFINDNILSIAMMVLLILTGLFLSIKTKFFQFRRFGYVLKNTVGSLFNKNLHHQDNGSVSPFQAVTTALAGTIGTGSIAGRLTAGEHTAAEIGLTGGIVEFT